MENIKSHISKYRSTNNKYIRKISLCQCRKRRFKTFTSNKGYRLCVQSINVNFQISNNLNRWTFAIPVGDSYRNASAHPKIIIVFCPNCAPNNNRRTVIHYYRYFYNEIIIIFVKIEIRFAHTYVLHTWSLLNIFLKYFFEFKFINYPLIYNTLSYLFSIKKFQLFHDHNNIIIS